MSDVISGGQFLILVASAWMIGFTTGSLMMWFIWRNRFRQLTRDYLERKGSWEDA